MCRPFCASRDLFFTAWPTLALSAVSSLFDVGLSQKLLQVLQGEFGAGVPLLGGGRSVHAEGLLGVRVQR